jgi:hypothetical protein
MQRFENDRQLLRSKSVEQVISNEKPFVPDAAAQYFYCTQTLTGKTWHTLAVGQYLD